MTRWMQDRAETCQNVSPVCGGTDRIARPSSWGVTQTRSCTSSTHMTQSPKNVPLPLERLCHALNTPRARVFHTQLEANHHTHPLLRISTEIFSSQSCLTYGPSFLSPITRSRASSGLRLSCTEGASSHLHHHFNSH